MRSLREATPLFSFLAAFAFGCSSDPAGSDVFIGGSSGGAGSGISGSGSGAASGSPGSTAMGGAISVGNAGGGGAPMVDKCVGTKSATTAVPPILGFLIDTSGSMNQPPDGAAAGTPTKWISTRDALTGAFTTMAEGTGAGLLYYPNTTGQTSGTMCFNPQVAVPVAPINMMQRQAILNSLQRTRTNGNTPTHDAYKFAVQTMQTSTLIGSKYVVLVTDGSPTFSLGCVGNGRDAVDAAPIVAEAALALTAGIKTFVIGAPGSEMARASLSQMASQGGTPRVPGCSDTGPEFCHFDMTTAPDLAAALNTAFQAITGSVVSCTYTIPAATGTNVVDPTKINVNVVTGANSTPVPKATAPDCTEGWLLSADNKQISLCPETCNKIKNDMSATVDVVVGCTTLTL